jgi:hypothetical protein
MLEAIKQGESDPQVLAELAKGRLREKLPALRLALDGRVQAHHQLLHRGRICMRSISASHVEEASRVP